MTKDKVVKSLAGVQALVRQFGEKEEIEVRVGNTIASLSDVKPMRKLLRKMIARKVWCVAGVSKLQPFEGIATKVCNAQQILSTLMRITDPKNAGKLIHIANQVPLLLCCSDKLFDSIADLAKDLRRLGRQMENISFAPLTVILLGQDLKAVGKGMKLKLKKLKKKKGSPAEFHGELCRVKRFCNEVYNQAVPLN